MTSSLNNYISCSHLDVIDSAQIPVQAMSFCGLICSVKRLFERFCDSHEPIQQGLLYEDRRLFQKEYTIIQVFKEFSYIGSCVLVLLSSTRVTLNIPALSFGSNILNVVSGSLDLIAKIRGRFVLRSLLPDRLGVARVVFLKELKKSLDFKIVVVALRLLSASFQLVFSVTGVVGFGVLGCLSYLFSVALQCHFSNLNKNNNFLLSRNRLIRELVVG